MVKGVAILNHRSKDSLDHPNERVLVKVQNSSMERRNRVLKSISGHSLLCPGHSLLCPGHALLCPGHSLLCPVLSLLWPGHSLLWPGHSLLCPGSFRIVSQKSEGIYSCIQTNFWRPGYLPLSWPRRSPTGTRWLLPGERSNFSPQDLSLFLSVFLFPSIYLYLSLSLSWPRRSPTGTRW